MLSWEHAAVRPVHDEDSMRNPNESEMRRTRIAAVEEEALPTVGGAGQLDDLIPTDDVLYGSTTPS